MTGLAFALGVLQPGSHAGAAEGVVFGGPIGGTDIKNAFLPTLPGFYGSVVGNYNNAGSLFGADGGPQHVNTSVNAGILAGSVSYVYPFKLYGGILDTFVQQGYIYDKAKFGNADEGYDHGALDLYTELLGWSRYLGPLNGNGSRSGTHPALPVGLTIKLAYSMIFPTGEYGRKEPATPGHNDFFFIPNAAATYLTRPNALGDGIEYDLHVFADLSSRNPATDYKTGPVLDVDFAVADRIGKYEFGLAGEYAQQLLNDEVGGQVVQPDGKRLEVIQLGPVFAVDFPSLKSSLKAKILAPAITLHNSANNLRMFLSYSFKF